MNTYIYIYYCTFEVLKGEIFVAGLNVEKKIANRIEVFVERIKFECQIYRVNNLKWPIDTRNCTRNHDSN